MKKNKVFKDSRPLEMLDYLDEAYVAEVVDNLDLHNEPGKPLPKKVVVLRSIRTAAILVACAVLLGAAVPLVGRLVRLIPDIFNPAGTAEGTESNILETNETEPPVVEDLPEEYFPNGRLFCGASVSFGAEYEGKWIHSSQILASNVKVLAAYDPADGTTKSICVDPNCSASGEKCPVITPIGWKLRNSIQILDDWCLYYLEGGSKYDIEIRMYNMKTGEARVILEDIENGNIITYPVSSLAMNGKVYINLWDIDNGTGKSLREYISCYDPKTDTTEYLCDEPEDLTMISVSNKRIFFSGKRSGSSNSAEIWSTDYSGGNLKKEEVLNFYPLLSGTYAYDGKSVLKTGNTFRVYDLETDSISTVDFGGEVKYLLATSSKLCYVFKEDGKVYLSDPLGENRELVLDRAGLDFKPCSIIGDYLIGEIPLACDIMPGGTYALNIKTGELKAIPEIN